MAFRMASQRIWPALVALGSSAVMLPAMLSAIPAQATVKLNTTLIATENCEALQSIKKRKNAGNIRLSPGESYRVIGKNRPRNATHYLLRLSDVKPSQRWVAIRCGSLEQTAAESPEAAPSPTPLPTAPSQPESPTASKPEKPVETPPLPTPPSPDLPDLGTSRRGDFLLALSWQPAFCETKPTKTECRNQSANSFEAGNLALHGLWPQPRGNDYCGVSAEIERLDKAKRWDKLPPIDLSPQTREALAEQMPGYASNLHLHEWYKHGTCYSNSPEEYYRESLALMDQVNASLVKVLFEQNRGERISRQEIHQAFDQTFGSGAGQKVEVACARDINQGRRVMVQELRILLRGKVDTATDIADLLAEAPIANRGCSGGLVDLAGVDR